MAESTQSTILAWKFLLLVVLFLLCLFPCATTAVRNIKKVTSTNSGHGSNKDGVRDLLTNKENGTSSSTNNCDYISVMDYSPARKRPPIHN